MIRLCGRQDQQVIYEVINDASQAYKGIIPEDRYHEPYMPAEELMSELEDGVVFWGYEEDGEIVGVMGIQDKGDVSLIRHAYVRTRQRNGGIGTKLLHHLISQSDRPVLIGTWGSAEWAIRFYVKNGFRLVSKEEKEILLRQYWNVPERQIETSVVLCDERWQLARCLVMKKH
ncbi:GNAT family N-acetyltransferase [Paenibacillus dokdonensis]|uniref:GNAT family N-acetyltransferase n=1 Tax=Paenibacillus dokdonensis TaxID=2567944 RepID=UPI0010A912C0|nr:GNAT family N-acetyltransferase [Paenibacillus dokdonensis]